MKSETAQSVRGLDIAPEHLERVRAALDDIRAGKMVILVDDEDRENEGDLCLAADRVTPEAINFMAMHGRGLICLTLTEEQVARLRAAFSNVCLQMAAFPDVGKASALQFTGPDDGD